MKHISSFRALKGIVALVLLSVCTSFVHAQTKYYYNVWQKDGVRIQYAVSDLSQVTVSDLKQPDFRAEYVDLGLSVKWATCNIGAVSPEEYGNYYSWGDTEEVTADKPHPYKWYDTSEGKYTKYNLYESQGNVDMLYHLEAEDDIATVGGTPEWRIPTDDEFQELLEKCSWEWTDSLGIEGYLVTSKINDKSIFLPAAGFIEDAVRSQEGIKGLYLSNTLSTVSIDRCRILDFSTSSRNVKTSARSIAYSVRPVFSTVDEVMLQLSALELNSSTVELMIGEQFNLNVKGVTTGKTVSLNEASWQTSDAEVATVKDGTITAKKAGTCTITATFNTLTATCTVNVQDPSQPHYVDLGLSVRWATFNVGATEPEEYGDYYAWGETTTKADYTWSTYAYCNDGYSYKLTKYCYDANGNDGFKDNKYVLEPADDVAHTEWGGNWRMPLSSEFNELLDSCSWNYTTLNGVSGYRVTSKVKGFESNSIFIPSAGYKTSTSSSYVGSRAYIWTSSLSQSSSTNALAFGSYYLRAEEYQRYYGYPVRPVNPFGISDIKGLGLNAAQLSLALNGEFALEAYPLNGNERRIGLNESITINWSSSNLGVATVTDGAIKAVAAGSCVITAVYGGYAATCKVTVKDSGAEEKQSVDLGLGVKWATFNLGAFTPEMIGDYYAWGETEPYYEAGLAQAVSPEWKSGKTNGYSWDSYFDTDDGGGTFNKYYNVGGKIVLDNTEDAANASWNGTWRIPSTVDFQELMDNCTWTWTELNGVKGYRVTSNVKGFESNSIFLPVTSYREDLDLDDDYSYGVYWTRSLDGGNDSKAQYAYLDIDDHWIYNYYRKAGISIRPVQYFENSSIQNYKLNYTETKLGITEQLTLQLCGQLAGGREVQLSEPVTWTSSSDAVATVNGGVVTAVSAGNATITATYGGTSKTCTVTVVDPYSITPEYVNLGLSVNWATFNLGAYIPEKIGDFFAWGETEPYYEAGSAESNSPVWKGGKSNGYSWSSYFDTSDGGSSFDTYYSGGGLTVLGMGDDAAHFYWGGTWRLPSPEEFNELYNKCTWTWTIQDGYCGYLITSNVEGYTDKSIFLPVAGYRYSYSWNSWRNGYYGGYWTNALSTLGNTYARYFYVPMYNNNSSKVNDGNRYYGYSIRPVCTNSEYVDKVLLTDNVTVLANDYEGGTRHQKVAARTVTDPADASNQCIVVTTNASYSYNYDAQLLININDEMKEGDILTVSMRVKAATAQNIRGKLQNAGGSVYTTFSTTPAGTGWQYYRQTFRVQSSKYNVFAIDLSYLSSGNNCYFDDISVTVIDPWKGDFVLSDESTTMKIGANAWLEAYDEAETYYTGYAEWTSSNEQVVEVDNGYLTAKAAGTATISATYRGVTKTCVVTVPEYEPVTANVNLGLSVNWATCNIGANTPTDYGFYYAWGETEVKRSYQWNTYYHYNNYSSEITKYITNPYYSILDNKMVLDATDDVASVILGGNWRMASSVEFEELLYKCDWEYTSENGVYGYRITSTVTGYTDRSIFLPFAGYKYYSNYYNGGYGYYWSSSLYDNNNSYAISLYMNSGSKNLSNQNRYYGFSIRPVTPNSEWDGFTTIEFDYDDIDVTQYNTRDLGAEITITSGGEDYTFMKEVLEWTSSDPDVATVDKNGFVTAVAPGNATITATYKETSATCDVTVTAFAPTGNEYGKGYIDLGLPSGTKWATCNVGANDITGYGDYFAWGETEPYYSAGAQSDNPTWKNDKIDGYWWTSYFDYYNGSFYKYYDGGKTVLDAEEDVAHVKWGGNWRMPTKAEQDELRNNCTWTWVSIGGVNGYKVTSNIVGYTDKWIFLPASGYRYDEEIDDVNEYACYWSKTLYEYDEACAYNIYIYSDDYGYDYNSRYQGYLVRPVFP